MAAVAWDNRRVSLERSKGMGTSYRGQQGGGGGVLSACSVWMWGRVCDKPSPRADAALLTLKHFDPLGVA